MGLHVPNRYSLAPHEAAGDTVETYQLLIHQGDNGTDARSPLLSRAEAVDCTSTTALASQSAFDTAVGGTAAATWYGQRSSAEKAAFYDIAVKAADMYRNP